MHAGKRKKERGGTGRMFEFLSELDLNKIMDSLIDGFINVFKIPFKLWNAVPLWVHYGLAGFIFLLALLVAFVVFKYRNEWRYRY